MAEDTRSPEDKFLAEARKRFKYCHEAETKNRQRALDAIKFRNLEQWPQDIKNARETDPEGARPCLVVDKLNQYINQVKNDQRQNRPAIKVRPVDDKGDKEVADIFQGIIRHVEDTSKADHAYDTAFEHAVDGGFGYFRILTEYCDEDSFDQDIKIKRIRNRFSVYLDPDHQEPDGSDAKYGFISEEITRDEFKAMFPGKDPVSWEEASKYEGWCTQEKVRIAEYFYYENVKKKLLLLDNGMSVLEDDLKKVQSALPEGTPEPSVVKERETTIRKVHWCKINGKEKLEEKEWAGKWIPIIEVVGNEIDIEGERVLSGLIRGAMDAQRIHNYASSSFVENVALAPKAPFTAAAGQLEGHESEWKSSNRRNLAVLTYNPISVDGHPVPPPIRQPMPGISPGWQQVLANTEHDIQASMGMYSASLGEESNEKSGRAIMARQREGDIATFHYIDNLSRSIRHCGRILVDLIPKIYDTARVARILGEDGTPSTVQLNPEQQQAVVQQGSQKIYNLNVGKYDVTVSVGPSYTTKRQEAAESMVELVRAQPALLNLVGDLMIRNMDWPGAEQIADRLKTLLPPEIRAAESKENEDPKMAAIHAQYEQTIAQIKEEAALFIQQLQQKLEEALSANQDKELTIRDLKVALANKQGELQLRMQEAQDKRDIELAKLAQAEVQPAGEVQGEATQPAAHQPGVSLIDLSVFTAPLQQLSEVVTQAVQQSQQALETTEQVGNALNQVAQQLNTLTAIQTAPKTIEYGPDGLPVSIGGRGVKYDEQGRVIALEGVH